MNLIRVGTKVVNLDRATNIDLDFRLISDGASSVVINFGPSAEDDTGGELWLKGDEAVALRYFLESNAVDVMAEYESHQRVQAFKASIARLEIMGRELGRFKATDPNTPVIWDYYDIKRHTSNYAPEMDEHIGVAFGGALDTDDWATAVIAWTQAFIKGWSDALAE